MNKLITILTVAVLGAGTFSVYAASNDDRESRHRERMERRMEMMTENLDLTKDQQKQIRALFEKHKQERKARREAMKKSIQTVLTKEQQEKSQKLRKKRRDLRCQHGDKGERRGMGHFERHDDDRGRES